MKIGYANYNNYTNMRNSVSRQQNFSYYQPAFEGAKARKFLQQLRNTTDYKHLKVRFEELVSAYAELGYPDVVYKSGSHATLRIDDNFNLPLVIPHKDKHVSPFDIRRLKLIMLKEFEKAKNVH